MLRSTALVAAILSFACTSDPDNLQDASPSDQGTDALPKDAAPDTGGMDAAPMDAAPMDAAPMDADSMDADSMDVEPDDATDAQIGDGSLDAGRSCMDIETEYQALVSMTRCMESSGCQVVLGHCGVGLGGCWYTTTTSVTQAQLDLLGNEYTNLGCTSAVCSCIAPPNSAICDANHFCVPGP